MHALTEGVTFTNSRNLQTKIQTFGCMSIIGEGYVERRTRNPKFTHHSFGVEKKAANDTLTLDGTTCERDKGFAVSFP